MSAFNCPACGHGIEVRVSVDPAEIDRLRAEYERAVASVVEFATNAGRKAAEAGLLKAARKCDDRG